MLQKLLDFDVKNMKLNDHTMVDKYVYSKEWDLNNIAKTSTALSKLAKWVQCLHEEHANAMVMAAD